jgi:hypothetical protein
MTDAEKETKATLTRYGTDAWSVVFSEPQALAGVQLDFLDDDVTASYKGLEFSVPQSAQAVKTELHELMEIIDGMAQNTELDGTAKEEHIICEGEIDVGSYTLTFAQDGIPLSFSLPCYGLEITFDSFTENGTASETLPETSGGSSGTAETETVTETAEPVQ